MIYSVILFQITVSMAQSGKSYSNIVDMASKYFSQIAGVTFYERDFLAYGCFCNYQLNDKPTGRPVDAIDRACESHRQCYSCTERGSSPQCRLKSWNQKTFGKKYKWKWIYFTTGGGEIVYNKFRNTNDKCTRDVFECDKQLVKDLFEYRNEWQSKWHFSNFDYREEGRCQDGGPIEDTMARGRRKKNRIQRERTPDDPQRRICCGGGENNPFKLTISEKCT